MSDENAVPATPAASGDAATAVPEVAKESTAETADAAVQTPIPEPKKIDPRQKKIAELSYKDRENQRRFDRLIDIIEKQAHQSKSGEDAQPKLDTWTGTLDEFVEAKIEYADKKREKASQPQIDPKQREYLENVVEAANDLISTGSEKYDDFEDTIKNEDVKITPVMRDAIFQLDEPETRAEVAYFLGKNPKEAMRISKLSPMRQITEIARIELKLNGQPTPKRPSAAPAPIAPVGGNATPSDDITGEMDFLKFKKIREKQLGRK